MPVYSVKGGHAVKKVTVRMIGAAVGVSHSTVSRVLNNDPRVHPETRDLVLKTMRQMGYRIETGNGRRTVALILGNNRMTGYVSSVLEKLLFALRQRGMRAELVNSGDVELLGSRAIVGAIALALEAELNERWSKLQNLPLVRLNSPGCHRDTIYSVRSDGDAGMKLAVNFLLRHGHRRIAFLSDEEYRHEPELFSGRFHGFCEAMRAAGEREPERFSFFRDYPAPGFRNLLDLGVTAAICVGELHGAIVARKIHEEGLRVPEEFSLLSLEMPRISENLTPPHTTLSQDFEALAEQAVCLLEALIDHRVASDVSIPYRLIERRSVSFMH